MEQNSRSFKLKPSSSLLRKGDLVAFRNEGGTALAFHSANLEVAELDQEAWTAFQSQDSKSEASREIEAWAEQTEAFANPIHRDEPHVLQMNISQICNLKCNYCAAGGDGTYGSKEYQLDLSAAYKQIAHMLNQLDNGSSFRLNFIGGEPLLYPKAIEQVARYAKLAAAGRNIRVLFGTTTNGTLISKEVARLIADLNMSVTVSLDGPPAINDVVRPAKRKDMSSTQLTENGLSELQKVRGQLRALNFNAVFGVHNTDLVATYEYLSQWQPDSILFSFASEKGDDGASDRYIEELSKVLQKAHQKGGRRELLKLLPFSDMLRALESQKRKTNFCGAGKTMLNMDTKGDLYACNWFISRGSERLGVAGKPEKGKISQYSQSFIDLNDCNSCWARFLCGGGCMLFNFEKNGDKHKSDLQFCDRTRKMAKLAIEYYHRLNG